MYYIPLLLLHGRERTVMEARRMFWLALSITGESSISQRARERESARTRSLQALIAVLIAADETCVLWEERERQRVSKYSELNCF